MQKEYKQAVAEVILFDNSDVIRTSGEFSENTGGCKNRGHSTGNGCKKTSGLGGETGSCKGAQKIK